MAVIAAPHLLREEGRTGCNKRRHHPGSVCARFRLCQGSSTALHVNKDTQQFYGVHAHQGSG